MCRVRVSVYCVPCSVSARIHLAYLKERQSSNSNSNNNSAVGISNAAVAKQIRQTIIQVEMHAKRIQQRQQQQQLRQLRLRVNT